MNDHAGTRDGFFSRHPRMTMTVVALTILVVGVSWVLTALRSGRGAYGHTIDGAPTMFRIEILVMSLIALSGLILALRIAVGAVRRSGRSRRF